MLVYVLVISEHNNIFSSYWFYFVTFKSHLKMYEKKEENKSLIAFAEIFKSQCIY
jgi:hypothetical protein